MEAKMRGSAGEEPSSTFGTTATTVIIPLLTVLLASRFLSPERDRGGLQWSVLMPFGLAACSFAWMYVVSNIVSEPYLDEIFHIPQAQTYCQGRFWDWDDKITTPPGLYLFSLVVPKIAQLAGVTEALVCDARTLRAFNVAALCFLSHLAYICRTRIEARHHELYQLPGRPVKSSYAAHTALNIGLFPLLFFFSGLYYTDVLSTATVLAAYANHLQRVGQSSSSILGDAWTITLGLLALLMRQTNIFWVGVYMGGLEAVHAVKTLRPTGCDRPPMQTLAAQSKFFGWRYSLGEVHDLPLSSAWPTDVLYTILSLVIAILGNPLRVLRHIYPYVVILASFVVFVVWNGGVVLGDKSNHVATIHLAQMLYIWPLFAFFSAPLFLPCLVEAFVAITGAGSKIQKPAPSTRTPAPQSAEARKPAKAGEGSAPLRFLTTISEQKRLLWVMCLLAAIVNSVAIVKFNTIIHPFTLADNRHYMFYVFRYSIRRAMWVRYALVAIYTVSRLLVWSTMAGCYDIVKLTDTIPSSKMSALNDNLEPGAFQSPATSTGLMFLLSTTLSLITAPLVEPRYFIIPWVMWRLQVPAWKWPSESGNVSGGGVRLWLESLWFLLVNLATGYIFLYRPYHWRAEDGTLLEDGRLQRFMW
jgi:alpha-1,2-glucosyltransferase